MARPRESRSPAPAGSFDASRHRRRDEDRRERDRWDDRRQFRRPSSRSRSPERRQQDRGARLRDRDRDRERDLTRRRERSLDRRDDSHFRGASLPHPPPPTRDFRDRDRDRDRERERDRDRDRQRDHRDRERGRGHERRRSRDRVGGRPRSPDRRNRSRGSDKGHQSSDPSRDVHRSRHEGTADSTALHRSHQMPSVDVARSGHEDRSRAAAQQSDADKKAERLAKLNAWKKKKENESMRQKAEEPSDISQAIKLLAEMDKKASMASSATDAPVSPSSPPPSAGPEAEGSSPPQPYAGKFDPKTIAKRSAASRSHESSKTVLGSLVHPGKGVPLPPPAQTANDDTAEVAALPANRGKASGFGFGKAQLDDKLPAKRKQLDLDGDDTVTRKLRKLPAFTAESDDTPYADQDEDYNSGDNIAEDEEAAVAADRAAHERRRQAESQDQTQAESRDQAQAESQDQAQAQTQADGAAAASSDAQEVEMADGSPAKENEATKKETTHVNGAAATQAQATKAADITKVRPSTLPPKPEPMQVDDEEDEVDTLDAFMADLQRSELKKSAKLAKKPKKEQEPVAYFSDDDNVYDAEASGNADNILTIANKRKKKDIPSVDYSKLDLEPVRKNFWVEPSDVSAMSDAEVAELRAELDGIKVKGKSVPKPVQKWAQCGLTQHTLEIISRLGYEKPTTIQMQAIPALMSGRDIVGVAKTGSGKTIAFLLPMFRHIMDQPPLKEGDGPIGLIMTPTRELATQIHRDCKPFLQSMKLRAVCAYGGAPVRDQIAELKRGAEIIVCTPGRAIDLLAANQGRVTNLKRVTYVVLDEADRMFDMGFEPQVMKIFANMRPDRQTILFSATMPRLIDSLTKKVLTNPVEITVGGRSVVAKEIEQVVEVREESSKFLRVLELLGELYNRDEDARTLIFVERQEKADDMLKELLNKGYPCMSIHGGKDQVDRDSNISDFKRGVCPILVATSVAARGLDVKQLKLVINYDAPNHMEDYVHRSGRTGRAGNKGVAVTFVTPEQENCAPGIAKALEYSGQPVPEKLDEMRKSHREKVKAGKAKDSSGFGGKGLDRLDQEREAARQVQRRTHRAEGDEEEDKDEKKDENKGEKTLNAMRAAASIIQARDSRKAEGDAKSSVRGEAAGAEDRSKNPLDKVSSAVSAINSRLGKSGQLRSGQPIDNKGPDAGAFHATLEINHCPQKARWAVTNRTNVAKILDATGTSITTKGSFYAPGKEVPPNGDPKLYILIEGETEVAVGSALQEMTRLLEEATHASNDADNRAPASGRYTVT
ncbi:hypothetical protein L249_3460 [Ophiocordyceps polyrhachis-furcata BCC 54312]|uniref:RNA helicase n=1 Tax=Ophiocordyceps polyrhachis-furcata BCC 54312 TaxID=1330021 RepID=A0A367LLW1_9HYPO|nr:hypothetical protein L249_3460 [Ophiocordyceps polyrhachis-furcata BCC 54312]